MPLVTVSLKLRKRWCFMTESVRPSGDPRRPSIKTLLDVIATVALTVAAGVVIWTQLAADGRSSAASGRSIPIPDVPLAMDGTAVKGLSGAPVGLIGFSDFQCPYCGRFAREVLPELERDYVRTGKLQVVFRHLPLERHAAALPAAAAVECAGQQGKFWDLHDRLFAAEAQTLTVDQIQRLAESAGVAVPEFDACLANGTPARVLDDVELARGLGVTSTPTFFVGSILPSGELSVAAAIPGALPVMDFRREIEAVLTTPSITSKLRELFRP